MFVILIGINFALGWISLSSFLDRKKKPYPLRIGLLMAFLFIGLVVATSTELLGLFDLLNRPGVAGAWTIVLLFQGVLFWRCREAVLSVLRVWKQKLRSYRPDRLTVVVGIYLTVVLGSTAVTALVAPPNNEDSMSYHMSRVFYWAENANIDFFPTRDGRQLFYPPFAEYCILHLQILTGEDRLANLVQWSFFIGCLVACSLICAELGGNHRHQLVTVVFSASLPMGLLQAPTTQNDLVVTFWVLAFAYFAMRHIRGDGPTDWAATGAGLGLAILTKPTALFAAFPFVIWVVAGTCLSLTRRKILQIASLLILALLINAPHWSRNFNAYGHPFGSDTHRSVALCADPGFVSLGSSFLRHFSMHFKSSDLPLGNDEPLARNIETIVEWLHGLVGASVDDVDSTWLGQKFNLTAKEGLFMHEDYSGFPLHLGILLLSMVCSPLLRYSDSDFRPYLLSTIVGFLLMCLFLKWHPWMTRFHVTYALLAVPFGAFFLSHIKKTGFALLALCVVSSLVPLYSSDARPWFGDLSIFRRARDLQYLANAPILTGRAYSEIPEILEESNIKRIGLLLKGASSEYPLLVFIKARHPNVEFEHIGLSGMAGELGGKVIGPEPEILIANILGAQMVEIDGASYSKMWGNHGFQIYGGGAEELAKDSLVPLRTIREIGFDSWEGPYPEWGIFSKVRWILGNHAVIEFQPNGPVVEGEASIVLSFDAMSHIEKQEVRITVNGDKVLNVTLGRPLVWQTIVTVPFRLKQSENHLNIDCSMSGPNSYDPRDMALLIGEIRFSER